VSYSSPRDERSRLDVRANFAAAVRKIQEDLAVECLQREIQRACFRLLCSTKKISREEADEAMQKFFDQLASVYAITVEPQTEEQRRARIAPVVNVVYVEPYFNWSMK